MSGEKNFVDLVMKAILCGVSDTDSNQSKSILWQYASYREDELKKLRKIFEPIDTAWKKNGKRPVDYRKSVSKQIVKANHERRLAGLKAFEIEAVKNIGSIQQGQQYAEVGKWLELYGEGLFADGRKKETNSFLALVKLEIKLEKTRAIFRLVN